MQASDKAALRRQVRADFDPAARDAQSAAICRHVLDWEPYRSSQVLGAYMPMKHEADITPLLVHALQSGKTLALPRCAQPPVMTFHRVCSLDELTPGAYGLLEPSPDAPLIAPEEIDLLLTPLEAIDRSGMRLGKGGGYYDCLLGRCSIPTLGVVLSWQWTEQVHPQSWDKPLNAAADARGIHLFD